MRGLIATGILCLVLVGCGSPVSPEDVPGVYEMRSVNGKDLPATVDGVNDYGLPAELRFFRASLQMNARLGYLFYWELGVSGPDGAFFGTEYYTGGTYYLGESNTIHFTSTEGDTFTGRIDGQTVRVGENSFPRFEGIRFEFKKPKE